jgi:hypothetical protein
MARLLRYTAAGALCALVLSGASGHAQAPQPGAPPAAQAPAQQQPPTAQPPAQQQPAQQQPQQPAQQGDQPPIFRAGINFVRVDVIVTDRSGNPVHDLKPEDFEIVEDGKLQTIETFKLISLDGGRTGAIAERPREIRTDADEETEAARDDVRLFAFFLDDYHVRRESSLSAREQLSRFVDTQVGPSDMVGVMYPLEATAAVRMTRNHEAVSRALQQFEGRKFDYTQKNEIEQSYYYYPTEAV